MRPLTVRALLAFALAGPLQAGQIELPASGELTPGKRSGAVGVPLNAPIPIQLAVPPLAGANPLNPVPVAAPVPSLVQSLAARPAAVPALPNPAAIPAASARDEGTPEAGVDAGRLLFDQSSARPAEPAPASGGLWSKVRSLLPLETVPAWPGKAGDAVRVGRIKAVLGKVAGHGGTSTVWQSRDENYAIKILHPETLSLPDVRREAETLRAIGKSDLPVAKLLAESRDGRVLVKEFIKGETAQAILDRGAFTRLPMQGWPELAAKLIKAGVSADLARGNLVWQHWEGRWVIVDGGGLTDARPRAVLEQMMDPDLLSRAGVDPVEFLSGLRARLGPDSAPWAKTLEDLRGLKAGTPALAELARRDAAAPAGPVLVFGPAPKGPAGLDDTIVSAGQAAKRLGYDPLLAQTRTKLHGDDPGKLNTVVLAVEQPGKTPLVVKIAEWKIIRNEVALRRLARRFFGRYVRVPASLAVKRGSDSYLVMEQVRGSPNYYKDSFNGEQRVAMALFAHTFGISDMNLGNVFTAGGKDLPWLIDFELALGRSRPIAGRFPDERITYEMPWMSRFSHNRVEDYQPGVRAWRALLAKPETRAAILNDLTVSGFTQTEAAELLARFDLNAADLDWTLQNDADFVNQFVDRKAGPR